MNLLNNIIQRRIIQINNVLNHESVYIIDQIIGDQLLNISETPDKMCCINGFYHKVDNLTKNLQVLLLVSNNNILIDNLPNSVKCISLTTNKNIKIDNLPLNLKYLELYTGVNSFRLNKIPRMLTRLSLSCKADLSTIPSSIHTLELDCGFNGNTDLIPEGIKILKLNIDKPINDLPSSIEEILVYEDQLKYINKIYHNKVKVYSYLYYDYIKLVN